MKPGPVCTICAHPRRAEAEGYIIDDDLGYKFVVGKIRGVSQTALRNHIKHHGRAKDKVPGLRVVQPLGGERLRPSTPAPDVACPDPPNTEGMSEVEAIRAHASWLQKRIAWGQATGEEPRHLQGWSSQFTAAQKHLAKLTGAYEVTESQIIRSPKFIKLMSLILEAIGDDVVILGRVRKVIEIYETGDGR
jgi:hypothetical protein